MFLKQIYLYLKKMIAATIFYSLLALAIFLIFYLFEFDKVWSVIIAVLIVLFIYFLEKIAKFETYKKIKKNILDSFDKFLIYKTIILLIVIIPSLIWGLPIDKIFLEAILLIFLFYNLDTRIIIVGIIILLIAAFVTTINFNEDLTEKIANFIFYLLIVFTLVGLKNVLIKNDLKT